MREISLEKKEFKGFRPYHAQQGMPKSLYRDFGLLTFEELIELVINSKKPQYFTEWPLLDVELELLVLDLSKYIEGYLNGFTDGYMIYESADLIRKRNFLIQNCFYFSLEIKKFFNKNCILIIEIPENFSISEVKFSIKHYESAPMGYRYYRNFRFGEEFKPTHHMQEGWLFFFEFEWKSDSTVWKLKELLFENNSQNQSGLISNKLDFRKILSSIFIPQNNFLDEIVRSYLTSKLYKAIDLSSDQLLENKIKILARMLNSKYGVYTLSNLFIADEEIRLKQKFIEEMSSQIQIVIYKNRLKHVFLNCSADCNVDSIKFEFIQYSEVEIESERYKYVHYNFLKYITNPDSYSWRDAFWLYVNIKWNDSEEIWKLKQKILFQNV